MWGGKTFLYNALVGAYYDKDKNFISGIYVSGSNPIGAVMYHGSYHLIIPSDCKYIRVSVNDNDSPKEWELDSKFAAAKTIVWFGDSIVGNTKDESSVTEQLSICTGALVYDMGFGGCTMSARPEDWDLCSMYKLADYIYYDDFTLLVRETEIGWEGMPGYFRNTARVLADEIDFKDVDVIIISFGTNDYRRPTSILENIEDDEDVNSVCGALRHTIRRIQDKYPKISIIVTSPIYRFFLDDDNRVLYDSNEHDFGSGTLKRYSDSYKAVCEELDVSYLDLYNDSLINETTRDIYFSDGGTHPNADGRKEMVRLLSEYLNQ